MTLDPEQDIQNCIYRCQKLAELLEEDGRGISQGLQGGIDDAYREKIQEELDAVRDIIKTLWQTEDLLHILS